MPDNLIFPVVHINGSGADNLIKMREEAYNKLDDAYGALLEMSPNGRDYYPGGPDFLLKAIEQHQRRLGAVDGIMKELQKEMSYICDHSR